MPMFEGMAAGYRNLWKSMKVTRVEACERAAKTILAGRDKYLAVERKTGVPWFFVGLLHMRESSCNFAGVLHNGEHIIGTGRKTRLVPEGRGPFVSWEEAAIDALRLKDLHAITAWPVERIGYESERFNGFGYIKYNVNSPYVWAGSQHYLRGKYVRDGLFDTSHVDQQLGTMPVLKALCDLSPEVKRRVESGSPAKPTPAQERTTVGVGILALVGGLLTWLGNHPVAAGAIAILIAVAVIVAMEILRKKD